MTFLNSKIFFFLTKRNAFILNGINEFGKRWYFVSYFEGPSTNKYSWLISGMNDCPQIQSQF